MQQQHVIYRGIAQCTPIPFIPGPNGPRLSPITTEFHRHHGSIAKPTNIFTFEITCDGMEVGEARCHAVDLAMNHDPRPEFIFFLDYDVLPSWDCLQKLFMRARHYPDYDIFSGVYCSKSVPSEPLIYKDWGSGPFWEWSIGDILTDGIIGVHMGLTLIRTSLFERMTWDDANPLFLTVDKITADERGLHSLRGTEDLYFCDRALKEANAKILVDTSVLAAHIDNKTGIKYGLPPDSRPVLGAKWIDRNKESNAEYLDEKKALDIGAGGRKREWEGYRTYSTDIRPDVGADYVQDTLHLNLPDNEFDLIASSHHLEHIPRTEQQNVWDQMYRICKPGGKIEHIVPNIAWASAKVMDGQDDEHVFNVFYGAQETHGYRREWNLHYYGYTPLNAKAHAIAAGFVNVEIETYKENPELKYNLIIRGEKPLVEPEKIESEESGDGGDGEIAATAKAAKRSRTPQRRKPQPKAVKATKAVAKVAKSAKRPRRKALARSR